MLIIILFNILDGSWSHKELRRMLRSLFGGMEIRAINGIINSFRFPGAQVSAK